MEILDCIIVGGGPAGSNAAVVLGRCRRKVLLFDTSQYPRTDQDLLKKAVKK